MKNVSMEMNNEVLEAVAGLFDITATGVEKEALVEQINGAIENLKSGAASRAKAKWFEAEGAYPYTEGDTVKIVAGPGLIGRFAEVIRPSSKKDAVKAFLLTPKEGERQGTLITLDFVNIEKSEFVPVAPKVTKKDDTPAAEANNNTQLETPANSSTGDTQEPAGETQDTPESTDNGEEVVA